MKKILFAFAMLMFVAIAFCAFDSSPPVVWDGNFEIAQIGPNGTADGVVVIDEYCCGACIIDHLSADTDNLYLYKSNESGFDMFLIAQSSERVTIDDKYLIIESDLSIEHLQDIMLTSEVFIDKSPLNINGQKIRT